MDLTVADLMTPDPATVGPDAPAVEVLALVRTRRIRHVPVVEDGALVGIVSDRDLLLHTTPEVPATRSMQSLRARDLMTSVVRTAAPYTPLAEAGKRMLEAKFSCLPVLDEDRLVGILTESDFVRALSSDA